MVTFAPAPIIAEPGIPPWAQRLLLKLAQRFVPAEPSAPQRVASIPKIQLPPAADWPQCIVWVPDQNKLAVSNGTAWVVCDGGVL